MNTFAHTAETANDVAPKGVARSAGALYLIIAIAGGFAIGYLPTIINAAGDPAATVQNMLDNQGLYQLGILGEIVVLLAEVVLTGILYKMLKPVSPTWSLIAAFARMAMVGVMGINILFAALSLALANGSLDVAGLLGDDATTIAALLLDAKQYGVWVWGLFFALHLFVLGYLVICAAYLPTILGALMGIGGLGYLLETVEAFFLSGNETVGLLTATFLGFSMLGEIGFTFYLLIRGLNAKRWQPAPHAALQAA